MPRIVLTSVERVDIEPFCFLGDMTALTRKLQAPTTLSVPFEGSVAGVAFERAFAESLEADASGGVASLRSIEFDFTKSSYIDPYSMQLLISYICACERYSIDTRIRLPHKDAVRDAMRAWGFQSALLAATNRTLFSYVDKDDRRRYFRDQEKQTTFDLRNFPKGKAGFGRMSKEHVELLRNRRINVAPRSKNFFGFNSFDVKNLSNKIRTAHNEKEDWKAPNIASFLESKMGINAEYLASRVVFEALFNALRHPAAEIVQTAALPRRSKKERLADASQNSGGFCLSLASPPRTSGRSLTFHYWDDGDCMLDVLSQRLTETGSEAFRTGKDQEFFTRYQVRYFDRTAAEEEVQQIDSDFLIDASTPQYLQLVALAFPHFSSAPNLDGQAVAEEVLTKDARLAARGMGLYLLVYATTQIMNGKVGIRTGDHYVEYWNNGYKRTRTHPKWTYDINADVWRVPPNLPRFAGNLISIRIPSQA